MVTRQQGFCRVDGFGDTKPQFQGHFLVDSTGYISLNHLFATGKDTTVAERILTRFGGGVTDNHGAFVDQATGDHRWP